MKGLKVIGFAKEFSMEDSYEKIPKFWDEFRENFRCIGPMSGALQSVNTRIFNEWLPGNNEFEIPLEVSLPSDTSECRQSIWNLSIDSKEIESVIEPRNFDI